jgi:cytochrome c oxidase subunit 1
MLTLPVSEAYHDEKRMPLFDKFKPWLIAMAIILILAYVPAFMNVNKNTGPKAPAFSPDNPVPIEVIKK